MVDAQDVDGGEGGADAVNPPGEMVLFHQVPAIEGVAPELPIGGEVIRWHARHSQQATVFIHFEQVGA